MTDKVGTIKIKVGGKVIGAVQSLDIQDNYPIVITSSREIIERDPYPVIQTTRMRFDKLAVAEAFSRGFVHVQSQRYPFDIEAENSEEITTVRNCWITSCSYTYTSQDWIISDGMDLIAENVLTEKKY